MHQFAYMPMNSRLLNAMECLNQLFVLLCSYFLLLFTDLIPQVETRYVLGEVLMYIMIVVITFDFLVVLV